MSTELATEPLDADLHGDASLDTEAQATALVRQAANEIYDPCGMAAGLQIGLADMGLLREVTAESTPDGWIVEVHIRLTSPGCDYFFYFKQELERKLTTHPDVAGVSVIWDEQIDWTPEDLAPEARARLNERSRFLHRATAANTRDDR